MKKIITVTAMAAALALAATAALAQGQGKGHGPPDHAAVSSGGVTVVASHNHGEPSPGSGYGDLENSVGVPLTLADGSWKVTASGASEVVTTDEAPNCGIVLDDNEGLTVLAKQNFAESSFVGRSGFAVTGATTVEGGEVTVHLVCYGGTDVFEHNLVAVGG